MPVYLAVALGGAFGSVSRYGVDRLIERRSFSVFPWATFTINATGCLLIGVLIGALVDRDHAPEWLRIGLVMGFVGGYTTFSTFAQESLDLFKTDHAAAALAYGVTSVVVGIATAQVGAMIGRTL
jgi:fluoride exporter